MMRPALTLLLLVAGCNEKKNPWAIDWTPEQRRAWPLGCPGTTITEEEGTRAVASVIAKRVGDGGDVLPLACGVGVNNGRVTSIGATLTHDLRDPDKRSPEVDALIDHVLSAIPARYHKDVRAVAESKGRTRLRIGGFDVSGGHDRPFWGLSVTVVP